MSISKSLLLLDDSPTHMPLLPPLFTITDPHKPVASASALNPSWSDFGPVVCSSEKSQSSRISTPAEHVQPCYCAIRVKLTRLMKCNLTGGGNLPTAGGVSIRYAAVFCMPCSPLYHSHHIPRVMASGGSRISRWVGLWCRSTRNVTLPGQSIALAWVITPRDIWWHAS